MKFNYSEMTKKNTYIWGYGNVLRRYYAQLDPNLKISAILDTNKDKWGKTQYENGGGLLICKSIDCLKQDDKVIVAMESANMVRDVGKWLNSRGIEWCHIYEAVDAFFLNKPRIKSEKKYNDKIVKFIDTIVPIAACNLKCPYCYLSQKSVTMDHTGAVYHHPQYIRKALSKDRMGGGDLYQFVRRW